ncbi:MAG: hypothetical protein KDA44_03480 [Planctomycetales bacterium]|nr:hypothetical protein [Planctomycetales bacterium]
MDDETHTYPDGSRRSSVRGSGNGNEGISSGAFIGSSFRFTTQNAGDSGWLFTRNDQQLRQTGLLAPEFFYGPWQDHRTENWAVNARGQVVGTTSTNPTSSQGVDLGWYFDPATGLTTRIGSSTLGSQPPRVDDYPQFLQENGLAVGTSGPGTYTAWVFDPAVGATREIGLPDSTDLGPDTRPILQTVETVTSDNLVIGTSLRNSSPSGSYHGEAVWAYDPDADVTTRLGFFSDSYVRKNGDKLTRFDGVNRNNLVVGRSQFLAPFGGFDSAWIYDPRTGASTAIGLGDPVANPTYDDQVIAITDHNQVIGQSSSDDTIASWFYDHATGTTTTLGFFDAEHTFGDGSSQNSIVAYADTGFVAGHAERSVGDTRRSFNVTPWIYNPNTGETQAAGLFAGGYTTPGGGHWAEALRVNRQGQAIGISRLFANSASTVQRDSAWFYDIESGQTHELAQDLMIRRRAIWNRPHQLNDRGQVAGVMTNNQGGGDYVWFYDHETGATTSDFDIRNEFTVDSNGQGADIEILQLTDSGLVLGRNERHIFNRGRPTFAAWLYDSSSHTTYDLSFSTNSEGAAYTDVVSLSESGAMFGTYDFYGETDAFEGVRYFYWSLVDGFHDLESLIVGDFDAAGWDTIIGSLNFSGDLKIVDESFLTARGRRLDGSYMPFALIRVPEPATLSLLCAALVAGAAWRGTRGARSGGARCEAPFASLGGRR